MRISDWSSDVCSSDLMTRRVVVTGLGVVTPLGVGVEPVWNRLILGHSGLVRLPDAIAADLPARVAGMVPDKDDDPAGFDPEVAVSARDLNRMDRFIHFALVAAHEAGGPAAWRPQEPATGLRAPTDQAR